MLRAQYPFFGLDDARLQEILNHFEVKPIQANEEIISQGQPADFFYIVYQGKLSAHKIENGVIKPDKTFAAGDMFGEQEVYLGDEYPYTVTALDNATLLVMERNLVKMLTDETPSIAMNLKATAESREITRRKRFDWMGEGEEIYLVRRKHVLFLIKSIILPITLALLTIPFLVFVYTQLASSSLLCSGEIAGWVFFGAFIFWAVYNWIDWGNDYYIVTNQRVAWFERTLWLYEGRNEAPLSTVLAVDRYANWFGRLLNYGTVTSKTYTGAIPMNRASRPSLLADYIEGFRIRALRQFEQEEVAEIEKALEYALYPDQKTDQTPTSPAQPNAYIPKTAAQPSRPDKTYRWGYLLTVRYEHNGEITYRKHWPILLRKIWVPLLCLAVFIAVLVAGWGGDWLMQERLCQSILVFIFLGLIFWLWYVIQDWRNDIYRLTPEQIFDIERKPLGSESKKSAKLENILSIEHIRENIFRIIFNYGTVVIKVGDTEFTFDGVYDPNSVHLDISNYLEALRANKRQAQMQQERDQFISYISAYDRRKQSPTNGQDSS